MLRSTCGELNINSSATPRASTRLASSRQSTPGSTFPSRSSNEAPPPVEMCDMRGARPALLTAATESPPPMIETAPLSVRSASVSAIAKVPLAKGSISKTPIGPFHTTVLQSASAAWISAVAFGPLSTPSQPAGIASAATTFDAASAANLSAMTTSVGRIICTPFALRAPRSAAAELVVLDERVADLEAARLEEGERHPAADDDLVALLDQRLEHGDFDDTFAPPTTAANGPRVGAAATAP